MADQEIAPLSHGTTEEEAEHYYGEPVAVMFFLVVALLLGVFSRTVLGRLPFPFTAWMLVWGILLGVITQAGAQWTYLTESLRWWLAIDPEVLLAVFLPPLVFLSASHSAWHVISKQIVKVLWLAFPGTLFGTIVTASLLKWWFPYDWTWSQCFLLGAILAPTDPVAVVAIMGSAGTPAALTSIVEGESLFNDGVAYVLFQVFLKWAEGEDTSVGAIAVSLTSASLGGMGMGLVFVAALMAGLWFIVNDFLAEFTLVLATVYTLFLLCDVVLGVSGLLAVVVLGVGFAAFGKFFLSSRILELYHATWEALDFSGNILLFGLAGLFVSKNVYDSTNVIGGREWGYLFALWLMLLLVRVVTVLISWPFLRYSGYPCSGKDVIILMWSGLRGAVAVALALSVANSESAELPEDFRILTEFFTEMLVLLTVILQGATMPMLLTALGYTKPDPVATSFMREALQEMDWMDGREAVHAGQALVGGNGKQDPEWEVVDKWTRIRPDDAISHKVAGHLPTYLPGFKTLHKRRLAAATAPLTHDQLVADARHRYLLSAKSAYAGLQGDGLVLHQDMYELQHSVDLALDRLDQPVKTFDALLKPMGLVKVPGMGSRRKARRVVNALALLMASNEASENLSKYGEECQRAVDSMTAEDGTDGAEGAHAGVANEWEVTLAQQLDAIEQVRKEAAQDAERASQYIWNMRTNEPELFKRLLTDTMVVKLLRQKASFLDELAEHGMMAASDAEWLQRQLHQREQHFLLGLPPRDGGWQPRMLKERLRSHPLFNGLPHHTFACKVLRQGSFAKVPAGAVLPSTDVVLPGGSPSALVVVLHGVVRVEVGEAAHDPASVNKVDDAQDGAQASAGPSQDDVQWLTGVDERVGLQPGNKSSADKAGKGGSHAARPASAFLKRYRRHARPVRGVDDDDEAAKGDGRQQFEVEAATLLSVSGTHEVGEGGYWLPHGQDQEGGPLHWTATAQGDGAVLFVADELCLAQANPQDTTASVARTAAEGATGEAAGPHKVVLLASKSSV